MVRLLGIDPMVNGSDLPSTRQLNIHLETGESPSLCSSRYKNHKVWTIERKDLDTSRSTRSFSVSKFLLISRWNHMHKRRRLVILIG